MKNTKGSQKQRISTINLMNWLKCFHGKNCGEKEGKKQTCKNKKRRSKRSGKWLPFNQKAAEDGKGKKLMIEKKTNSTK